MALGTTASTTSGTISTGGVNGSINISNAAGGITLSNPVPADGAGNVTLNCKRS